MTKHNIHLNTSSESYLGQTLSAYAYASSRSGYALNVSSSSSSHEWLIDYGASYHMGKDKAVFPTLNDCNTKNIFVGDDRSLSVEGFGIVHLNHGQIKDVLCVPNLSCNVLLVYQITHSGEGKSVLFTPHQVVIWDLKDPQHIVAIGSVDDITRLYKFDNFGSSSLPSVFVAHSDDVSRLWHEQFGHLNFRSLLNLCKEKKVTGLPMVSCKNGVCSGCVLGKHHWDSFEKHASAPLQLVHSDLCGPFPTVSFSAFKYFLTFVDDYSRRTWVYFLNSKANYLTCSWPTRPLSRNNLVNTF